LQEHWQLEWLFKREMGGIGVPRAIGDPSIVDKYALKEALARN